MEYNKLQYHRKYRENNKSKIQEYHKQYYILNKDKFNKPGYHHEYLKSLRSGLIELLGGKCIRCGFNDIRALQLDHINGGGLREVKIKGNNIVMYLSYSKNHDELKSKLQVLCANCNWIKRAENKEHRN